MTIFNGTSSDDSHAGTDSHMYGNGGDDQLWLTSGGDDLGGFIYGGDGNDTLRGSFHDDVIYGGNGADMIFAGLGGDVLHGGAGHDTFQFTFANLPGIDGPSPAGPNYILDFKPGRDTILIEPMGFLDPKIIYQKKNGMVLVDFDRKGDLDPVKVVKIDKHLKLHGDDIDFVA